MAAVQTEVLALGPDHHHHQQQQQQQQCAVYIYADNFPSSAINNMST
jgi:hypothetical protein